MEKIALIKCEEYSVELIEKRLREGFELLGGDDYIKRLIPPGSRVLLKPNMLSVESKGSAVVTHHAVFEAVIRIIREYTKNIVFGDSPGFGDSAKAAEKAGLMEVAKRYNIEFDAFKDSLHIKLEDSLLCKSWNVAKAANEADVVITLPKLKTHGMAYFTGAIKNQFGCIPGTQKATWHTRMPDANNFCKMLLDLNKLVGTSFAIMDGIIAMEGNGPMSGTPYRMNTLILGQSISAVDSVAARLIGYDNPLETPVLKEVYDSKWGAVLPEDIVVLGESMEAMKAKNFKLCRKGGNFYFINPKVSAFLTRMIAPNPVVVKEKCISCRRCQEVCPEKPGVIEMIEGGKKFIPKWNMQNCIRCFCCQELCPAGAIEIKHTTMGKLLNRERK